MKVKIKQKTENSTLEEIIEVSFSDDQIELFKKFVDNLNNLKKANIFKKKIPLITEISWNEEGESNFKNKDFENEDIKALLHSLRHFILVKDSPASFQVIKDILGKVKNQTNETQSLNLYLECLKHIGNVYQKGLYQPYFQIKVVNKSKSISIDLFTEENLNFWLNGKEYHQNPEKEKKVQELEEILGKETSRAIYISQMFGKIEAIFMLGKLVNSILDTGEIILARD